MKTTFDAAVRGGNKAPGKRTAQEQASYQLFLDRVAALKAKADAALPGVIADLERRATR